MTLLGSAPHTVLGIQLKRISQHSHKFPRDTKREYKVTQNVKTISLTVKMKLNLIERSCFQVSQISIHFPYRYTIHFP